MKKAAILFYCLISSISQAAIGDKLQGNWKGTGKLDEFALEFPLIAKRQGIQNCRSVTVALSTASNRLKLALNYECGTSSGSSNFNYVLRDVTGKLYREVIDAGPPVVVLGRLYDDRLDVVEHLVDEEAGDLTGVLATLTNSKKMEFRLSWSGIGEEPDSFAKYLLAPLKK